jgi:hypothetical protein
MTYFKADLDLYDALQVKYSGRETMPGVRTDILQNSAGLLVLKYHKDRVLPGIVDHDDITRRDGV